MDYNKPNKPLEISGGFLLDFTFICNPLNRWEDLNLLIF